MDEKYDILKHPNIALTEDGGAAPINTVGRKMPLQRSRLQALPPKPYLHQTNPYPIMSFFPTRI